MYPVTIVAANRKDNSFLLITKILLHIDHVTVNDFSSLFVRLFAQSVVLYLHGSKLLQQCQQFYLFFVTFFLIRYLL